MTFKEKIESGFYEEDRAGYLVMTSKGRQHFCKHHLWLIKFYNREGKPKVTQCASCGLYHNVGDVV